MPKEGLSIKKTDWTACLYMTSALTDLSLWNWDKLVSIIPVITNDREGEDIIKRGSDLDTEPEILSSEEVKLIEAFENQLESTVS
jgi:hypothetical protein